MNKFYVYGHYTIDTNELFYVGKGCEKRAWCKYGRNQYWNNIVRKHGFRLEILVNKLDEPTAFIQEILAIKELNPKANLAKGGGGSSGVIFTQQRKDNISKAVRLAHINNPNLGKKLSDIGKKRFQENPDLCKIQSESSKSWWTNNPQEKTKQSNRMKRQIESGNINVTENASKIWQSQEKRLQRAKEYGSKQFQVFKNGIIIGLWVNKSKCSEDLSVPRSNIRKCLNGMRKTAGGYEFQYV